VYLSVKIARDNENTTLTAQQVINETAHFDFSCLSFTMPWRRDDEPNPEANIYATAEAAYDALDDLTGITVKMQALFSGCLAVTVAQLNRQHQLTTSDSFNSFPVMVSNMRPILGVASVDLS